MKTTRPTLRQRLEVRRQQWNTPRGRPLYSHGPVVRRMLAGYLVLTMAVGYSFYIEREHSNGNRAAVATATRQSLTYACQQNNSLRKTLQSLVLSGIPQTEQLVKDGTLTETQANRSIAVTKKDAAALHPVDCTHVFGSIH